MSRDIPILVTIPLNDEQHKYLESVSTSVEFHVQSTNKITDIDEILDEGGTLDDAFEIFMRKGKELSDLPIAPLIIEEPIIVDPEDHVAKAATVLLDKQIRLLPVVDGEGKLVGTISRADVCRAVVGTL